MKCGPCEKCGDEFEGEPLTFNGKIIFTPKICVECERIARESDAMEERQRAKRARKREWEKICPPEYEDTDQARLPPTAPLANVLSWRFGPEGLLCFGDSRTGKTRSCWVLVRRLWIDEGRKLEALTEVAFSITGQKLARTELDRWLTRLIHVPVFFLDDIGHAATSGRALEEMYHVIEQRTAHKRPIIATTQFSQDEMETKSKVTQHQKTIAAICNRLREFSRVVDFNRGKS